MKPNWARVKVSGKSKLFSSCFPRLLVNELHEYLQEEEEEWKKKYEE